MKEYGLIGKILAHSHSMSYFTKKFEKEGIAASYALFELPEIAALQNLIEENPSLEGFNVTIPYKQQIIPYCHTLERSAQMAGAVNTIKITRKKNTVLLKGYNTDIIGFSSLIGNKALATKLPAKALILGTGGASRAVQYVLRALGIGFTLVSRHAAKSGQINYAMITASVIKNNPLIINTTPLGMFPELSSKPAIPYQNLTPEHLLIDLVYNPAETEFLKEGKKHGATLVNGMQMFIEQAEAAWKIWQK
ncbi:MAG: shikimate dehydrogenase [Bacteroidetes bacterium]|jgi:shikimate dehydrogenase|nr:shikimate dehydrogenase [Bacteroidota bacterium]